MQTVLTLPIHWSLVRVDALAQALEAAYGLSQVRCQLIKATINDSDHVWASEGRFVLRISRAYERSVRRTDCRVGCDDRFGTRGGSGGSHCSLAKRGWERLLPIHAPEGVRYAVLFTFMEGSQLSETPEHTTCAAMDELWQLCMIPGMKKG